MNRIRVAQTLDKKKILTNQPPRQSHSKNIRNQPISQHRPNNNSKLQANQKLHKAPIRENSKQINRRGIQQSQKSPAANKFIVRQVPNHNAHNILNNKTLINAPNLSQPIAKKQEHSKQRQQQQHIATEDMMVKQQKEDKEDLCIQDSIKEKEGERIQIVDDGKQQQEQEERRRQARWQEIQRQKQKEERKKREEEEAIQRQEESKKLIERVKQRRMQRQQEKKRLEEIKQKRKRQMEQAANQINYDLNGNMIMLYSGDQLQHFQMSEAILDLQINNILQKQEFFEQLPPQFRQQADHYRNQLRGINTSYLLVRDDPNNTRMAEGLNGFRVEIMNKIGSIMLEYHNSQQGQTQNNSNIIRIDSHAPRSLMPHVNLSRGISKNKAKGLSQAVACKEGETCVICLKDFEQEQIGRKLRCNHVFHNQCLEEWLENSANCPSCRYNIKFS